MVASRAIESIYKKNFPKMVIALSRHIGLRDLATAEDIVQETFAEAARQWETRLPDNPEAWLYRVCRNIALKTLRDRKTEPLDHLTEGPTFEAVFDNAPVDSQLGMIVACIHPNFSAKNQVIFALRYVAGFRVDQIATLLGSPADTITKTLQRMRETMVRERIGFQSDIAAITPAQNSVLHNILYLMFSEGYKTSSGKSVLNIELCEDALGLLLQIAKIPHVRQPDTHALIALMLLNLSRFEARFDEQGDLVDLENQDRSKWNREMISVAVHHIGLAQGASSAYQIEAAIAWLHVSAESFESTDWKKIVTLYDRLLEISDSPFVRMNQSIALFYSGEVLTALHQMEKIGELSFMKQHFLYHLAIGKMHAAGGGERQAQEHFQRALQLSLHEPERRHIRKLLR